LTSGDLAFLCLQLKTLSQVDGNIHTNFSKSRPRPTFLFGLELLTRTRQTDERTGQTNRRTSNTRNASH